MASSKNSKPPIRSDRSAAKVRFVTLTEGNLRQGHLYLTGLLGFFPADSFGPASRKDGLGKQLTLEVDGLPKPVLTDIPMDANGQRPRRFFRNRAWVRPFFSKHKLKPGDRVLLEKLDRFIVRVAPFFGKEKTESSKNVAERQYRPSEISNESKSQRDKLARFQPKPGIPKSEYHGPLEQSLPGSAQKVNWRRFSFIDLFAGIGGFRLAFERVGGRCVFSSEWDEEAQKTYQANFGDKPHGDITKINPSDIPDHDVLCAGFPCQPFSIIGERKGFGDTRGTLFFSIEQILAAKKPAAFLLENVRQFKTHDGGRTFRTVVDHLTSLGYHTHTTILNALHYGVPQLRQRTFIAGFRKDVSFSFPPARKELPELAAFLEKDEDVDPKLMASDAIRMKRLQRIHEQGQTPFFPSMWHENKGGFIGMHPFSCALRHNASHNYLLVNGRRRLSGRECLRFQGFPDSFKIVVSHRSIRAQAGNSVAVPCVEAVATQMLNALRIGRARVEPGLFSEVFAP